MIIFLHGKDTFSLKRKLKELKENFREKYDQGGSEAITLDGTTLTMASIGSAAGTLSLFSEKRMIIVENIFTNKNKDIFPELLEYFSKNKEGENVVVFSEDTNDFKMSRNKFFTFLKGQNMVQEFNPVENFELNKWTKAEVEKRGASINPQAANVLAANSVGDLWKLDSEIEKVVNYKMAQIPKDTKATIEVVDVEAMSRGSMEENIFAFTDAVSTKDKNKASKLLEHELDAGAVPEYLMFMIIRQFRILLQIRSCLDRNMDQEATATLLKLHPYVIKKSSVQARGFSEDLLKKIYSFLIESDAKIKTGQSDIKTITSLLIAKI